MFATLLDHIIPQDAPPHNLPALDTYSPVAADLTPGTVFTAFDASDYAPALTWFYVVEPLDADGYLLLEVGYPDGDSTNWIHADSLLIMEVW